MRRSRVTDKAGRRRVGSVVGMALAALLTTAACDGEPVASQTQTQTGRGGEVVEPPPTMSPRPNLLVIEADDMRADDLRFMPRTRRLIAGTGLSWENSFASTPLCCPSRASLLTGRYAHNHRVLNNLPPYGFGAFDDSHTLATALQDAGYLTGLVGKYLNGYGWQPTRDGQSYDYYRLRSNVNGRIRSWPGKYSTAVTAAQTRALVRDFEGRPRGRPWFVWWNPLAPHFGFPAEPDEPGITLRDDGHEVIWRTPARPGWVRSRFPGLTRGAGIPPSGKPEPNQSDKPQHLRHLPPLNDSERRALAQLTRERAQALLVLDREVAGTLDALRRTGAASETIVVLTSDNGYYLGEHGKLQGKTTLHEPSIRVPLLLSGPGIPRGRRYDPVTTVDVAVTLAALAGVRLRGADGADLTAVVQGGDSGWDRPVILESRMSEPSYVAASGRPRWRGLSTSGVRLGRWKYLRYATGESELYDLAVDPLELDSIAGRPDVRRRLERLWRAYEQCAGRECRLSVPLAWRATPELNRRITEQQQRATWNYYSWRGQADQ